MKMKLFRSDSWFHGFMVSWFPYSNWFPETKKARPKPRHEIGSGKLIFRGGFGLHIHTPAVLVEGDFAVHEREERPVATGADVFTRDKLRAALPDNDAAGGDRFAAKRFHAEPFADAVAAIR